MNIISSITAKILLFVCVSLVNISITQLSYADAIDLAKKQGEKLVRDKIEPILLEYCPGKCKLRGIKVSVDRVVHDDISPGFEEKISSTDKDELLAPDSATVTLIIDDKLGNNAQNDLMKLLDEYLGELNFPIYIDKKVVHAPSGLGSESKIFELRDRVSKNFLKLAEEVVQQFCPKNCLLADFNLSTTIVNSEEAQAGSTGEFIQDGKDALRIKDISSTLVMDELLLPDERKNILEMLRLKTSQFKNVTIASRVMKFPTPVLGDEANMDVRRNIASLNKEKEKLEKDLISQKNENKTDSKTDAKNNSELTSTVKSNEANNKQENVVKSERIERVENGDAVQAELNKFKIYGLIFFCSILSLLIFIAAASFRSIAPAPSIQFPKASNNYLDEKNHSNYIANNDFSDSVSPSKLESTSSLTRRYEIDRLLEELTSIYAQQPRVAKQVFSRVLIEEGIEITAECIHLFGEAIVIDLLRDPSLQTDLTELMDYYIKNPIELADEEKLKLLKKLHSRTVAGKMVVLGSRSSHLFDFLVEMDALQILELVRTESITVKAIILTQCDNQKRALIYSQMDANQRMDLLGELSRIDYLPKDYIFNVSNALKRKRKENPKLNTEALPGSDVLVSLLERTGSEMQKNVVKSLETQNPEIARTVKGKLVSIETLSYLRDGQLLEVILSLKHEELIQFLKGTSDEIRRTIFAKSPRELALDLEEELTTMTPLSRETYHSLERKILNRIKTMAKDGQINLTETNERMFVSNGYDIPSSDLNLVSSLENQKNESGEKISGIRKMFGW